jgi:nitrilase
MPLRLDDIPPQFEFRNLYPKDREWINPGGSAIIGPKGNILNGPLEKKEELVIADIDLTSAVAAKWDLDLAGHYSRPDIFELTIDREARPFVREREPEP